MYSNVWRALSTLLQWSWFYRAWIVQEVSVSKEIYIIYGNCSVTWDDFIHAITYVVGVGIFFAYGGNVTYQALTIFRTRSQYLYGIRPMIHNFLLQNRSFIASDARDKVFGLLSLADTSNIQSLCIQPGYHLSAEQVYRNLAIDILQTRQDLDLFDAPRVLEDFKTKSLPSWVPDWNTSDPCVPLRFRGSSGMVNQENWSLSSDLMPR